MNDVNKVKSGMHVRTNAKLGKTEGMAIKQESLDARRPGVRGQVINWVPGHGGDVWWVTHADGTTAPYSYTEFEQLGLAISVLQPLSPQLNKDDDKFIPGARPGDLVLDGKVVDQLAFTVRQEHVRWLDGHRGCKVLHIVREGDDGLFISQRPTSADITGELEVGKTYELLTTKHVHGESGCAFWVIRGIERQ